MTEVFPSYYPQFHCRAAACRHTCCRGWEIDIDPQTRELYRTVGGALGEKLRANIADGGETATFCLTEDERCPFLLNSGLCQLILKLGEDKLCQICTDHPRFRSFFTDRTEVGVGLCCEAAAELILSQSEPMRLCLQGFETLTEEETAFLSARETLFSVARERSRPLAARMETLLERTGADLPNWDGAAWLEVYIKLERLERDWEACLAVLQNAPFLTVPTVLDLPAEQLLCYFLYRHLAGGLDDGLFAARTAFAVLSTLLVATLWQYGTEHTLPRFFDLARRYSAEIEYSDENTAALLLRLENQ